MQRDIGVVLVVTAICTHLGCSPSMVAAGSGNPSVPADKPAPTNLEIPPHQYLSDANVLIDEDGKA